MKLLWWLVGPVVRAVTEWIPEPPEAVDVVIPWPAAVPFAPFAVVIASVLLVGSAALALRFVRWLYGLVPVAQ